jgi:recombinational DNA repair ATPase RecF
LHLSHLQLTNFRSFENAEHIFQLSGTAIRGDNGIGKSNLLESIFYLAIAKSGKCAVVNVWVDPNEYAPGTKAQTMYK